MNYHYIYEENDIIKGGFFVNLKRSMPHLQHFFLLDPYRTFKNFMHLARIFTSKLKSMGYDKALLHASTVRQAKLIQYFFKKKPYAMENGICWFTVSL